ncbi:BLOC-1 related complex subunit 6 isoform X2 [Dermatophagoides pteronyssinus]|uniref:Serine/threonine-protein kinase rio2-like isoform X2 n=1 Tax=Dermatophagoides pteronyssinus TaxID=6956 RepID=A0A6P6YDD6_DERPT|nr:serine/threonine-protein kinase rio2-like isoform X2 [Dermatophagoides pteronyssinus]
MDPESEESTEVKTPISSPSSTTEASMCPDYISSYTQISQYNHHRQQQDDQTIDDQTDIESETDDNLDDFVNDDDDDDDDQKSPSKSNKIDKDSKNALPELSSQIIEWSKKTFESYNKDSNVDDDEQQESNSETTEPKIESEKIEKEEEKQKLKFFQLKFINDIEQQTLLIVENLNQIMTYINSYSTDMTNKSVDVMEIYHDNVIECCDQIDSNIKLMYKIISKCEELNKSFGFLDELRNRIKDIKQTLDIFERIVI